MARTSSAPRQPTAKHNGAKFLALCAALRRNDPTVTHGKCDGSTRYSPSLWPTLGHGAPQQYSDSAATLIKWLRQCPSLSTVILHYHHRWKQYDANDIEILLLQRALQALAQNATIQVVDLPCLEYVPVSVWTGCLATSGRSTTKVHSMRLVFKDGTSDSELDVAAKTIGVLSTLKNLYLKGPNVRPILQELQSESCHVQLLQLTLEDDYHGPVENPESIITLLSSVVRKSKQLRHLSLCNLAFTVEGWRLVSSSLQANPSVTKLKVEFPQKAYSKEAITLFLNDMRCTDASKQHIRNLTIECYGFEGKRLTKNVASVLCGSLIRHFCHRLAHTKGTSLSDTIQLESLQLDRVTKEMLQHLAPFVKKTVYLRRLTCNMSSFCARRHHEQAPDAFLVALRRNASLHEVHLNGFCEILSRPEARARQAIIVRTIDAVTTSNRLLPGLPTRALVVHNDNDDNTPSSTTAAAFRQFPALCVVSTHAPRMAANSLLEGLLPVLDAFEPIHRRDGKRVCNNQA